MLPVPVQRDFESRADDASAPLSGICQFGEARQMDSAREKAIEKLASAVLNFRMFHQQGLIA